MRGTRGPPTELPFTDVAAEPAPASEAEQLIETLKAMHPDEMSSREALEALYRLKSLLGKTPS